MPIPKQFRDADENYIDYDGSPIEWRVSAYVLVLKDDSSRNMRDSNKEILIHKNKTEQLCDIPGGGVEYGETIEQALVRESEEEAGVDVKVGDLVYLAEDYFYHREIKKYFQTIQLFYSATAVGKLKKPTEKNTEWVKWVKLDELDKYPLPGAVKKAISLLPRDHRIHSAA